MYLNHFDFQIEYRSTADHQNEDALSRLPLGENQLFDEEESAGNADIICAISTFTFHTQTTDPNGLQKKTTRDDVILQLIRFTREEWPLNTNNIDVEKFQKLTDFLSTLHGCLLYGTRVVIASKLRS